MCKSSSVFSLLVRQRGAMISSHWTRGTLGELQCYWQLEAGQIARVEPNGMAAILEAESNRRLLLLDRRGDPGQRCGERKEEERDTTKPPVCGNHVAWQRQD